MESQRTLLHPPAWEPGRADRSLAERLARGPARRAPAARRGEMVLDRYRLLERLGRGGFGEVWRAQDELLHRQVAVKRVWLGPERDGGRAIREALAAGRLSHRAIVALYEARAVDDAFYLISELVEGDTLARLIAGRALSDAQALEIGAALADALAHAHARGVIHRDIKPQNVIVPHRPKSAGAAAKLTDFGGASLVGEDALTRTGDVLGTLAYMAPEQSEGGAVGEQADLYALALVLYEALCGVNPVRGPTPAATARRIGRRIEPLERRRGDLPRPLARALDVALRPAPAERGTLEQLRARIAEALAHGPQHGPAASPARPPAGPGTPAPAPPAPPQPAGTAPEGAHPPRSQAPAAERPARAGRGVLALPRRVWAALLLLLILWQAWTGRAGVALLLLAGALPLLALPFGSNARAPRPARRLACALAPALGAGGLAGAFPALAGQASAWRERAALGALGYWWLVLAEPLLGRRLWLGPPAGMPARASWEGSLGLSATHVLAPLFTTGVALGAALWAVGALVLPWLVRGRSAPLDALAAIAWTTALAAVAPVLDAGLAARAAHPSPRGAVLGALLAALLAVAARALRGPV